MKFTKAEFHFEHPLPDGLGHVHPKVIIVVSFRGDVIWIRWFGRGVKVDNKARKHGGRPYKPCETHAASLVRHRVLDKAAGTEHDKQRRAAAAEERTGLRVFK